MNMTHLPDGDVVDACGPRDYETLVSIADSITEADRRLRHAGYTELALQVYDIVNAIHEEVRRTIRERSQVPH